MLILKYITAPFAIDLLRIKEKEKEEKRKAVIQAQESASSNTSSVPTGTAQNDLAKPNDKPKISTGSPTISSSPGKIAEIGTPRSPLGIPKVLTNNPPIKPPQSPTTNIQIRIEPSKKPEIVFTDVNVLQGSGTPIKQSSGSAFATRESSKETNEVPKAGVANTVNTSVAATLDNTLKDSSIVLQGKIVTANAPKLQQIGEGSSRNNNEGSTNT